MNVQKVQSEIRNLKRAMIVKILLQEKKFENSFKDSMMKMALDQDDAKTHEVFRDFGWN